MMPYVKRWLLAPAIIPIGVAAVVAVLIIGVGEALLALVDPALPPWLDEATVHGLEVQGKAASFTVRRSETGFKVESSGPVRTAP